MTQQKTENHIYFYVKNWDFNSYTTKLFHIKIQNKKTFKKITNGGRKILLPYVSVIFQFFKYIFLMVSRLFPLLSPIPL